MQAMPLRRRTFLAGGAALASLSTLGVARATDAPARAYFAYVGSYTPSGEGIALYRMDAATGALTKLKTYGGIQNPSWLALDPGRTHLYAVSEADQGTVTAFAIDRASGELRQLNTVSSHGSAPAHLSVHPSGRFVLVGNYTSGSVAVLPITRGGMLGEATDVKVNTGPRNPGRAADDPPGNFGVSDHAAAHVHMVATDPAGRFVFVNDAGLDRIYVWTLDLRHGTLHPGPTPFFEAPPGAAPRHFVFHPNGRVMYDLFEQDSMLAVYDYDAHTAGIIRRQLISTLPDGYAGSNLASELLMSADSRFIYAANRLLDGIAVFSVAADGSVTATGGEWTRSDYPRSMAIDPTGRFMYSCNQRGDAITSFTIDGDSGRLRFTGSYTPIGSPVNLTFLT